MTTFVGLDLSWTGRYETGICWLEGESGSELSCTRIEASVRSAESLAEELVAVRGTVVVAIDAPLIVTRERWVEWEIGRRFGRYKASAHSANLDLLIRNGLTAGMDLAQALAKAGFVLDAAGLLGGDRQGRFAFEVYPHTIHVRLFGLSERLPYKAKRGRRVAMRRRVLGEYQSHLQRLIEREASGILRSADLKAILAPETAEAARGRGLKRLEDTLDGLTCAVSAFLAWGDPGSWEILGEATNGYIVAPRERDDSEG